MWKTLVQNIDNDTFSITIGDTFYDSPDNIINQIMNLASDYFGFKVSEIQQILDEFLQNSKYEEKYDLAIKQIENGPSELVPRSMPNYNR